VPPKELRGFAQVNLRPGETRRVAKGPDRRLLSHYGTEQKEWRADRSEFAVLVGRSSEQIELRGQLTLAATTAAASR
jgi:beta-glucosidase